MLQQFIEYEQALQRSELGRVRSVDGVCIYCQHGELWLTEDNGGDVILRRGEHYRARRQTLVLIEALSDAALRLGPPPAQTGWLSRFGDGLRQAVRRLTAPRHAQCR